MIDQFTEKLLLYPTFAPGINMQQGIPLQYTVKGINREGVLIGYGNPASWGSGGRLLGAARMCNIDFYPDNPDAQIATNPISPYAGMSTVELLAHEWSHYWLAAMDFKKEGMTEPHTGLRGWENDNVNQHWNANFMSGPSVMYGGDILDNEDGTFTFRYGNPKKYGKLDLYTMGMIPPEEVGELFFLCSHPDINQCKEGSPAVPAPKTTPDSVQSGLYKHVVTIDDIVNAMGERIPSAADSPKNFNIAFILANKEGTYPFPHQLQRLETLRVRFQEWFSWATEGIGSVCTELDGNCGNNPDEKPDENFEVDEENFLPDDGEHEIPDEFQQSDTPDDTDKNEDEAGNNKEEDEEEEIPSEGDSKEDLEDNLEEDESTGCGCTLVF
ncbi:MAG: hypothetical protein ACOX2F_12655 [bacterium]